MRLRSVSCASVWFSDRPQSRLMEATRVIDLHQSREIMMSGVWSSFADRRADDHGYASRDPRMMTALFTVMVLPAVLATLSGVVGPRGDRRSLGVVSIESCKEFMTDP